MARRTAGWGCAVLLTPRDRPLDMPTATPVLRGVWVAVCFFLWQFIGLLLRAGVWMGGLRNVAHGQDGFLVARPAKGAPPITTPFVFNLGTPHRLK